MKIVSLSIFCSIISVSSSLAFANRCEREYSAAAADVTKRRELSKRGGDRGFNFDDDSRMCLNRDGQRGLNRSLFGDCSDGFARNYAGKHRDGSLSLDFFRGSDLRYANFEGVSLIALDMTASQLECANLNNANLGNTQLSYSTMGGLDLTNLMMDGTILHHAKMRRARLNGSNIDGADLAHADLEKADLEKVRGMNTSFRSAHLSKTSFYDAELFRADFRNADLSLADLRHARLVESNFEGARLDGAVVDEYSVLGRGMGIAELEELGLKFRSSDPSGNYLGFRYSRGVCVDRDLHEGLNRQYLFHKTGECANLARLFIRHKDFRGMNFRGADFSYATLEKVDFRGSDLTGAKFRGARLEQVDFRGAKVDDANFVGVHWSKSDLREVDVSRAKGL